MFKVIAYIGRVLSPIMIVLFGLELLFSFPIKSQLLFAIELLVLFPCVLFLVMKLLFKIWEVQNEKLKIKIPNNVKTIGWIKVKLVILQIFIFSFAITCLRFLNYRFSDEKKTIIFLGILEIVTIIIMFMYEKNFYICYNSKDSIITETTKTTFYKFPYNGTEEDVRKNIRKFIDEYEYELDGKKGYGLFYSHFDSRSVCESCFSYIFDDVKNIQIMCWIKYCGKEYNMHYKINDYKVKAFKSNELKKLEGLVNLVRRGN